MIRLCCTDSNTIAQSLQQHWRWLYLESHYCPDEHRGGSHSLAATQAEHSWCTIIRSIPSLWRVWPIYRRLTAFPMDTDGTWTGKKLQSAAWSSTGSALVSALSLSIFPCPVAVNCVVSWRYAIHPESNIPARSQQATYDDSFFLVQGAKVIVVSTKWM